MNKLKLLASAIILCGVVTLSYFAYLGKLRSDCEGMMTEAMYLDHIVSVLYPDQYVEIVGPVEAKQVQVCRAMYKEFSRFWPDHDPFQVGR